MMIKCGFSRSALFLLFVCLVTVAFVVAIDEQQQQDFARPAAESTDALIPIDGSSDDATVRDKRFLGLFGSLLGGGRGRHYGGYGHGGGYGGYGGYGHGRGHHHHHHGWGR